MFLKKKNNTGDERATNTGSPFVMASKVLLIKNIKRKSIFNDTDDKCVLVQFEKVENYTKDKTKMDKL